MRGMLINNASHWRSRASEARTIAESMTDTACRLVMLAIARDYDMLAASIEQQHVSGTRNTRSCPKD
jgi:hypothetical protein